MTTTKKQLHSVQDTAKDFYQSAKEWLPENYTNPWVIGSGVAVIGLFGFFLGRSSRRPPKKSEVVEKGEALFSKPFDQDKIMKFAKLWLLYRATR